MLGIHDYWLFVVTGVLLNLTPGQDTLYILGRSIAQGVRIGIASALGISAGALVHTALAAVGLSAILATSESAFTLVRFVGSAYLVYLGVRMLTAANSIEDFKSDARTISFKTAFFYGALTNVLNPKVALFFLALMPQFIDPSSNTKIMAFAVLGLTFVATGIIWCLILAVLAGRLRSLFLRNPSGMDVLTNAAGVLFIVLGLRLAVSRH